MFQYTWCSSSGIIHKSSSEKFYSCWNSGLFHCMTGIFFSLWLRLYMMYAYTYAWHQVQEVMLPVMHECYYFGWRLHCAILLFTLYYFYDLNIWLIASKMKILNSNIYCIKYWHNMKSGMMMLIINWKQEVLEIITQRKWMIYPADLVKRIILLR